MELDLKNMDLENLCDEDIEKIENRIEELENMIDYENRKLEVCGYGTSDLLYIEGLEEELQELKGLIYE